VRGETNQPADPWPWANPEQRTELNRLMAAVTAALDAGDQEKTLAAIAALQKKAQEFEAHNQKATAFSSNGHKPERIFELATEAPTNAPKA
jgi:hypothetical protein